MYYTTKDIIKKVKGSKKDKDMNFRKGEIPYVDYKPLPIRRKYKIGIIGTGWVVNNYHFPAYKKAGFNVVAIADRNSEVVETTGKRWGIEKIFTDYKKLLELKEVEIVDVAIPTFGRVEVVKDVAQAGKHMLVQKPLSRSYRDAVTMVEMAEKAGVKMGVNSHYRWIPAFRGAYSLIQQGYIGKLYLIVVEMWGNQDDFYYYTLPERRWNAELDDFIQVEWGAHHFDYIRFWTGKEPISVFCNGTRNPVQNFKGEMVCSYIIEFPEGLRAYFLFNQANKSGESFFNFRIEGTEGVIKGASPTHLELYSKRCNKVWIKWELETDLSPGLPDSYIGTMGDLMNAITENREPISSGRDNLNTVRAYLAGLFSEKERRPVSPAEVEEIESISCR